MTATKNLHKKFHDLYDNESGSDKIFIVGDEVYQERMPAHSWVLAEKNMVFRAMFHGPLADTNDTIYISNDPKGFQNLLRWLYCEECRIQSLDSALITHGVAIKYLCYELSQFCAQYCEEHLNNTNVLKVMQFTWQYCTHYQAQDNNCDLNIPSLHPSAPTLEDLGSPLQQHRSHMDHKQDPTACCRNLFKKCIEVVKRNTLLIFASDCFEELDHMILQCILRQPTLNIINELVVFEGLKRWSIAKCKQRMLPLTPENKRDVLCNLQYHIRFLQMNHEHLQQTSELLTEDEFNYLSARISGQSPACIPSTLTPYLSMMSTPRCCTPKGSTQPTKKKLKKNVFTKLENCVYVLSQLIG